MFSRKCLGCAVLQEQIDYLRRQNAHLLDRVLDASIGPREAVPRRVEEQVMDPLPPAVEEAVLAFSDGGRNRALFSELDGYARKRLLAGDAAEMVADAVYAGGDQS